MKNPSPLVSIVLPVYNGSKMLHGAIDSCLKQTYRNFELIIVDDCSTDNTPEIIKSYNDPRLHYFRNEKNQRLPKSLNIGFRHTTGDYLTWTSDDNEYSPDAIEKMLNCLQKTPEAQFVYSDVWTYYEDTGKKERFSIETIDLKTGNSLRGSFIYTRKVYETIGDYNPHYEMVEDYDYWLRIFKQFKTTHLAEPVYLYRYHGKSLTTTRVYNQGLFDVILKYRSGYLPASKLGWTSAYYIENVFRTDKTAREKLDLLCRTGSSIFRLSLLFFLWFILLLVYYSILKGVRNFLNGKSILKSNKRSVS